jgi:exodeoxyribonuclease VII small subunit
MARTPASSRTPASRKTRFEDALKRLEDVVERLEGGEVSLEEALKLYEEGVGLSRLCAKKLDEAEKKIEILSRNGAGRVSARPFKGEDEDP